jgi:peptidoglycan/LPS O-acetylase OafA/YrhL
LLENGFGLGWSVSTEWFFYCIYVALVFLVFQLRTPRATMVGIVAFSTLAVVALIWAEAHSVRIVDLARRYITDDSALTSDQYGFHRWLFYYSPYIRVLEFIAGCLAAHLYIQLLDRPVTTREQRIGTAVLWSSLVILFVLGLLRVTGSPWPAFNHYLDFLLLNFGLAVPIAGVIFCTSRYDGVVGRLLSARPLVGFGEISYSIYAVHTWTLRGFLRPAVEFNLTMGMEALIRIPVAIIFSIIMASATYRLIEMPCRRYLRDNLSKALARKDGRSPMILTEV